MRVTGQASSVGLSVTTAGTLPSTAFVCDSYRARPLFSISKASGGPIISEAKYSSVVKVIRLSFSQRALSAIPTTHTAAIAMVALWWNDFIGIASAICVQELQHPSIVPIEKCCVAGRLH